MLRYIVGIAIAYGIGKGIYAVLWISRGFLISSQICDFLMITVWLVAIGCFIISRKSQYGKYLKSAAIGGLLVFLAIFIYWNIKARSVVPTTLITSLKGYSTNRIAEVCFRYNETPFWRRYNLNQYPNVKLLYNLLNHIENLMCFLRKSIAFAAQTKC